MEENNENTAWLNRLFDCYNHLKVDKLNNQQIIFLRNHANKFRMEIEREVYERNFIEGKV